MEHTQLSAVLPIVDISEPNLLNLEKIAICTSLEYSLFYEILLGKSVRHFLKKCVTRFLKKYLTFEIRLKMVRGEQSKVYYIKMAGKIANLNLGQFKDYFL